MPGVDASTLNRMPNWVCQDRSPSSPPEDIQEAGLVTAQGGQ
jgi:hypothetical protein